MESSTNSLLPMQLLVNTKEYKGIRETRTGAVKTDDYQITRNLSHKSPVGIKLGGSLVRDN